MLPVLSIFIHKKGYARLRLDVADPGQALRSDSLGLRIERRVESASVVNKADGDDMRIAFLISRSQSGDSRFPELRLDSMVCFVWYTHDCAAEPS